MDDKRLVKLLSYCVMVALAPIVLVVVVTDRLIDIIEQAIGKLPTSWFDRCR